MAAARVADSAPRRAATNLNEREQLMRARSLMLWKPDGRLAAGRRALGNLGNSFGVGSRLELRDDFALLRDLAPVIATRIFVVVAGVASSVITAKALGPLGRGEYFYVITLAQLATQIGHLGFASSNTYVLARDPKALSSMAANSVWVSLASGLLATAGMVGFEAAIGNSISLSDTGVLVVLVPSLIYGLLASNILVGLGQTRFYNRFVATSTGLQLAAIAGVALAGGGPGAMLWVSAGAAAISGAGLLWNLRTIGARGWRADAGMLADCWRFTVRAYIATLVPYLVSRMNVFMIEQWAGKAELGFYSIAAQFFDAFMILPASIAMLLFPRLIRKQGSGQLVQTVHLALLVAGAMIAGTLALGLLAPWLIPALFGLDFAPAVPAVCWMLPALIAFSVVNVVSQYLAAEGIPARKLWAWTASIPVMVVGGLLLIPTFGAAGGAMALSVTYFLLAIAIVAIAVTRADAQRFGRHGPTGVVNGRNSHNVSIPARKYGPAVVHHSTCAARRSPFGDGAGRGATVPCRAY